MSHLYGLMVLVMNMKINRLLALVYILLHKKSVSAGELAEQLGVSRRTIYRDIETLSIAGIPIYTEKGKGGGVSLLPDSALNKSILSEQEQHEILTALHGLSNMNHSAADRVLKKLSTIFNKTATNWLSVDFSDWSGANDYFNDFKTAILERRITEFDYYNSYGDKTTRSVEPIQLCFKSKSWYLKGFCLTKQDIRVYKLTRVKNLFVSDNHFSTRAVSDAQNNPTAKAKKAQRETLIKFRIGPEMKYRLFDDFDENEVNEQPDGSYIVTVSWETDNWVQGFVLSYGAFIEVLEPTHFRESIKEEAIKISKKYL